VGRERVRTGGVAKTTPFIWKKTGRGHSAVDVASWGVLSIDEALSSRLWTPVTRQFTLTIPIRIEFNSFAAARSCCAASQHRTSREELEKLRRMGMTVNSKAVFVSSSLGQTAAMEEDKEREAWKGIRSMGMNQSRTNEISSFR
jgi:hypothetical protein